MDKYIKIFVLISSRYFILAGAFFYVFYILLKKKKEGKKIQRNFPENLHYKREVFYSILTILIFSIVPVVFIQNEKSHQQPCYTPKSHRKDGCILSQSFRS